MFSHRDAFIGVNGHARRIKKIYLSVDGKARKVKKAYIGVDGEAKLSYTEEQPWPEWSLIPVRGLKELVPYGSESTSMIYDPYSESVLVAAKDRDDQGRLIVSLPSTPTDREGAVPVVLEETTEALVSDGNGRVLCAPYYQDQMTILENLVPTLVSFPDVCVAMGALYHEGRYTLIDVNKKRSWYSTDGKSWYFDPLPEDLWYWSFVYAFGRYIVLGDGRGPHILYSMDGHNWAEVTDDLPIDSRNGNPVCMAYGAGKLVVLPYRGLTGCYTADGTTWHPFTMPSEEPWEAVCYGNGKFVALTYFGTCGWSCDGITWDVGSNLLPSGRCRDIVYNPIADEYVTFGGDSFCVAKF